MGHADELDRLDEDVMRLLSDGNVTLKLVAKGTNPVTMRPGGVESTHTAPVISFERRPSQGVNGGIGGRTSFDMGETVRVVISLVGVEPALSRAVRNGDQFVYASTDWTIDSILSQVAGRQLSVIGSIKRSS